MSAALKMLTRLTIDEFMAMPDDPRGVKYELVDGELRAMSPASSAHGLIQSNVARLVGNRLHDRGVGCRTITEASVVPRLGTRANVRIPDIVVTCRPIEPGQMTIDDPILIVEILSPFNERRTRSAVRDYATIPTVREILLLHSTRIEAELFRKGDDGAWPAEAEIVRGAEALALRSVDLSCSAAEFYDGTTLTGEKATSPVTSQ